MSIMIIPLLSLLILSCKDRNVTLLCTSGMVRMSVINTWMYHCDKYVVVVLYVVVAHDRQTDKSI